MIEKKTGSGRLFLGTSGWSYNRFEGHAPETLARLQERLEQRGIDLAQGGA